MTRDQLIAAYRQALRAAEQAGHTDAAFVLGVRLNSLLLGVGADSPGGAGQGGEKDSFELSCGKRNGVIEDLTAHGGHMTEPGTRTVLTLRAQWLAGPPEVGAYMQTSQAGRGTVYRIVQVVRVSRPGDPSQTRYRLVCARVSAAELPPGVVIHAWRWDRAVPRQRPSPESPPAAPRAPPPVISAARSSRASKRARLPVHRRDWSGVDFGPSLRRRAVRDHAGLVLREPDVELTEGPDPAAPNRSVRRAVRSDPVAAMLRSGSITGDEADAVETLRTYLEHLAPAMVGGGVPSSRASPYAREGLPIAQIVAATCVRRCQAALGNHWPPVLWTCLGGSASQFAAFSRVRKATALEAIRDGLAALAEHMAGRSVRFGSLAA
jgi:hypothetical protein